MASTLFLMGLSMDCNWKMTKFWILSEEDLDMIDLDRYNSYLLWTMGSPLMVWCIDATQHGRSDYGIVTVGDYHIQGAEAPVLRRRGCGGALLHFSEFLCISLHSAAFPSISLHSLHLSLVISISLHFSSFHYIPLLHFPAFLCISLHFSAFFFIYQHFSAFFIISLHFTF